MTIIIKATVELDMADIETSDMLDELEDRDDWDDVCRRAPTESLSIALGERDEGDYADYRDALSAVYDLLHLGRTDAALGRVRELCQLATGRVL